MFSLNLWYIIDKTPLSFEKSLLFSSCELELFDINNCIMSALIIDAAKNKVFFMIINGNNNYNIAYENSKNNYEKLALLISDFLRSKSLDLSEISQIYVNRGPGSFAGIRNSLAVVKAMHLVNKTDYYCFSFSDFLDENEVKYEKIPSLCKKFKIKKNLINPIYLS